MQHMSTESSVIMVVIWLSHWPSVAGLDMEGTKEEALYGIGNRILKKRAPIYNHSAACTQMPEIAGGIV